MNQGDDSADAARVATREAARLQREEERPILAELAAVGVVTAWLGGVPTVKGPDSRIYPILLDHLMRPHSPLVLEWLGRAFEQKSARPHVWDKLVRLLKDHALEPAAVRGALLSISGMAKPSDLPTLIDFFSDRQLGVGRVYLVANLMRSKRPEAREALLQNRNDPDLQKEIAFRLRKSRA